MPLDPAESFFPYNVVDLASVAAGMIDPRIEVFNRPLTVLDPDYSVAVIEGEWEPDGTSREISGEQFVEPTVQRYTITVQGLIRDYDQQKGRRRQSQFAHALRVMLYRNSAFRETLRGLTSTEAEGKREVLLDFRVVRQQFLGNEKAGAFIFLSALEAEIKTQTRPA